MSSYVPCSLTITSHLEMSRDELATGCVPDVCYLHERGEVIPYIISITFDSR